MARCRCERQRSQPSIPRRVSSRPPRTTPPTLITGAGHVPDTRLRHVASHRTRPELAHDHGARTGPARCRCMDSFALERQISQLSIPASRVVAPAACTPPTLITSAGQVTDIRSHHIASHPQETSARARPPALAPVRRVAGACTRSRSSGQISQLSIPVSPVVAPAACTPPTLITGAGQVLSHVARRHTRTCPRARPPALAPGLGATSAGAHVRDRAADIATQHSRAASRRARRAHTTDVDHGTPTT